MNDIIKLIKGQTSQKQLQIFKGCLDDGLVEPSLMLALSSSPFFKQWMSFTQKMTDAPDEFLAVGGLHLVSAVLSNRAFIQFGNDKIYPHLWSVLVAPSSFYHKTTALNMVKRTLSTLNFGNKLVGPKSGKDLLAPDRFSIDYLLEELQERPAMILMQSEFGALLKELEKDYNRGGKETFTELYDSGPVVKMNKTIKANNDGNAIEVDNTALSIFCASTRDWLEEYVRVRDISAGFLSRFLFVPASEKTRFIGWPQSPDTVKLEVIKQDLLSIRSMVKGEFDVTAVRPFYELWYQDLFRRVRQEETISKTIGFDQRLAIYALKFAMIIHASSAKDTTLTVENMVRGIQIAEYFRNKTKELFATTFLSPFDSKTRKLAETVYRNQGKLTRRRLQQRMSSYSIRAREFGEIVDILVDDGDLKFAPDGFARIHKESKHLKGIIKK